MAIRHGGQSRVLLPRQPVKGASREGTATAEAIAPTPADGPRTPGAILGPSMRPVGHAGFVSLLAVYLFYRLSDPAKVASSPAATATDSRPAEEILRI
jgi:hypothetical protein